jgi:hypothetical protein
LDHIVSAGIARLNSALVAVLARVGCYRSELGHLGRDFALSPWRAALAGADADKRALYIGEAANTAIISRPVLVPVQRFSVPSGERNGAVAFLQFRQLVWSVKRLSHDPLKQTGHSGRIAGCVTDGVDDDLGLRDLVENEIGVRRRRHPANRIARAASDVRML